MGKFNEKDYFANAKAGGEGLVELLKSPPKKRPSRYEVLAEALRPYWDTIYELWNSKDHTRKEMFDAFRKAAGIDASDMQLRAVFFKIVKKVEIERMTKG